MNIITLLNKASQLYDKEDYKTALKYVEKICKQDSQNSSALIIKGNIFYQQKRLLDSLQCYLQALSIDSQNKLALINIANTYFELKEYQQSLDYSQRVMELDSSDKNALTIYGNSALELEKYDDAKQTFLHLLSLDSFDAWSYNSLSQIYQKTQDYERALSYGWKAVELSNGQESQHINFGYLLYEIGQENIPDSIHKYAKIWLQKYGTNSIVNHMGNAVLNNQKITRAKDEYVRHIFNAFADEFDDVLASLNYQAPQIIHDKIVQIYSHQSHVKLTILDAGCGTGLCGGFLKKYAKHFGLYGVDISEKMLQQAQAKKVYNKLVCDDLENYFFSTKKRFDLIVSADVFTYLGDLEKVISGCYLVLNQNGKIIFTVSANNINNSDYFLHSSGRFLHHKNYIEKLLLKHNFQIAEIEEHILRNEGENQVLGYLVTATKKLC